MSLPISNSDAERTTEGEFPRPDVRRSRWPYPLIWLVPLLVAAGASVYFAMIWRDFGPSITLTVSDASGVRAKETPVSVNGVEVGTIMAVELTTDNRAARVRIRLKRDMAHVAKKNTLWWITRPDLSGGTIRGLSTIVVGPHVEARVGDGQPTTEFVAVDRPPIAGSDGLKVLLKTPHMPHLELDSPVYFRGLTVGAVQDIRLGDDARTVNVTLFVRPPYERLVRPGSRFWVVKGTDIQAGVGGFKVEIDSIRALISGGVEFATPGKGPTTAPDRDERWFVLHDEPQKEWLDWSAAIPLDRAQAPDEAAKGQAPIDIE